MPAAKPAAPSASTKPVAQGYLPPNRLPDAARLIGTPPPEGSGTKTGDVATYEATRLLQGGERWTLATHDAVFGADAMLQDFSCALGLGLAPAKAPALRRLLDRLAADAEATERAAKKTFRRPRPFVENGGPICTEGDDYLRKSYSYPSGHSTYGWVVALVLADLAPDRAEPVFSRAKVYGESRVVCGVHYESDVEAGRMTAALLYATLKAEASFRRDLASARAELRRLRVHPAQPPLDQCRLEANAEARPVW
jgi:acid phosphatase (class A)